MVDQELAANFRRAYQANINRLPNKHAQRTAQCPSIPTLLKWMFTDAQLTHIQSCGYCLKVLVLDMGLETVTDDYFANSETFA
jgi:hypothetical protein